MEFDERSEEVVSTIMQVRSMALGRRLSARSAQSVDKNDGPANSPATQREPRTGPLKLPNITAKAQLVRRAFRRGRTQVLAKQPEARSFSAKLEPRPRKASKDAEDTRRQRADNDNHPIRADAAKTRDRRGPSPWRGVREAFHRQGSTVGRADGGFDSKSALPRISVKKITPQVKPKASGSDSSI